MDTTSQVLSTYAAMEMLPPPMAVALAANFGSVDGWAQEFTDIASALVAGGEVRLTFLPQKGSLINQWTADDSHAPTGVGATSLLTMGMSERACSIAALMNHIPWTAVHQRYQQAVHDASVAYGAAHNEIGGALLLDVRRAGVFEAAEDFMEGAQWRDPARVKNWASEFLPDQDIVVYCVAGHEMSRGTALQLRAAGLQVRFLLGGIEAWRASGKPTALKPAGLL